MKVHVYNQDQVRVLRPYADAVVISITTPGRWQLLKKGWESVLRIKFLTGTNPPEPEPARNGGQIKRPLTVFNTEIAEEIIAFCLINQNKDFVVHCASGLHRSMAVAAFIRDALGAELVRHVRDDGWFSENDSMYQMLMEHCKGIFS